MFFSPSTLRSQCIGLTRIIINGAIWKQFSSTSNPTYRDENVPTGAGARRKAEAGSTSSSSAVAVASACHTVYMEIWNKATVDRVILLLNDKTPTNKRCERTGHGSMYFGRLLLVSPFGEIFLLKFDQAKGNSFSFLFFSFLFSFSLSDGWACSPEEKQVKGTVD